MMRETCGDRTVGPGHQHGEVEKEMRDSRRRRLDKESEGVHPTMSREEGSGEALDCRGLAE
jgi:hypothetical protein